MAGKVRPTRLVMQDALRQGEQSVLEYARMKLARPAGQGVHQGLSEAARVAMKEALRKVLTKFGLSKSRPDPKVRAPPASDHGATIPRALSREGDRRPSGSRGKDPEPAGDPLEPPWTPVTRHGRDDLRPSRAALPQPDAHAADLALLENPCSIRGGFKIRVAKPRRPPRHAGSLVEKRYAGTRLHDIAIRGPEPVDVHRLRRGNARGNGQRAARLRQGPVGRRPLHAELDAQRERGYRLCEFTRLAVDKTVASKPVLAGLFHTAYLYASVIRGCTHAVIEVNPRHVAFYGRALRFDPIGEERLNARVNAPAVLLCAQFATIAEGIANFAGKPDWPRVPGARCSSTASRRKTSPACSATARAGAGEVAARQPRTQSGFCVQLWSQQSYYPCSSPAGGSVPVLSSPTPSSASVAGSGTVVPAKTTSSEPLIKTVPVGVKSLSWPDWNDML